MHLQPFKENPNLYVFLPAIYIAWSDAMLSQQEVAMLTRFFSDHDWLSDGEKTYLKSLLDPASPPSPSTFKEWLHDIKRVADPASQPRLSDISLQLAKDNGGGNFNGKLDQVRGSLDTLETALGLIGNETLYHFYPEKRNTITQQFGTQQNFSVATLTGILDGPHAELINSMKEFLSTNEFDYVETDSLDIYRAKVYAWCKLLADKGYGSIAFPKQYGGGGDMDAYFTVMEILSYHDLSLVIKFGVQFGLFGMSVYFLGTEKHHKKYLEAIGSLALPGCFAMTETGHGSNVRGIETTATYAPASSTFIIHTPNALAQKEYIGNAACHGQMATVFAKLIINEKDYGVSAFLVPLRDANGNVLPGVTIGDCGRKMGLNGVDNGTISFSNVTIPYDNMLDKFSSISESGKFESPIASDNRRFFTMLGTLVGGRIGIPRSALSAAKCGLTIAIRYGDTRLQFGPEGAGEVPILNYRTHQRRLMPLLANAYALHFSLRYLTDRFLHRTEEDMQEIEALAAGMKAYATWNTTHTLQECRECCGGKGYLSENRIDRLKNDSDVYTTFEGDNTVLMQLVAKSRLTEFKQEFGSMNVLGILNYVASQAKTSLTERNPLAVRNTDDAHLLDFEFHLNAFRYRERDILTSAAKRLKRHLDSGMDSFDAFNVVQQHLVQVGFAYVERVIFEKFKEQVERTVDEGCRAILMRLCQLFALSHLDSNKGWYLENGYMEGVKTKAIRKMLNQLCWEIRQDAVPLVNAFNIPDALISAPIALDKIV